MHSALDFDRMSADNAEPAPRLAVAFLALILVTVLLALVAPEPQMDREDVGLVAMPVSSLTIS